MATEVHDVANGNLKETTEILNDDGEVKGKIEATKKVEEVEAGDANGKLADKELLPKKANIAKHDFPEGEGPRDGDEEEPEARGLVGAEEEDAEEDVEEDDDDAKEVEAGEGDEEDEEEEEYVEDEGDEEENEEEEEEEEEDDDEEAAPEPPSKRRK